MREGDCSFSRRYCSCIIRRFDRWRSGIFLLFVEIRVHLWLSVNYSSAKCEWHIASCSQNAWDWCVTQNLQPLVRNEDCHVCVKQNKEDKKTKPPSDCFVFFFFFLPTSTQFAYMNYTTHITVLLCSGCGRRIDIALLNKSFFYGRCPISLVSLHIFGYDATQLSSRVANKEGGMQTFCMLLSQQRWK